MTDTSFSQRLVDQLGPDAVITAADEIAPWLSDWRGIYIGNAQAVVRPSTTDEVAACIALCSEARVPVVPVFAGPRRPMPTRVI
jgi:FAD/FMN-containing dehydrogenase